MSGWIKFEKSLESDPRVLRMAKALAKRWSMFDSGIDLDLCNATPLPAVTLVCGALSRLWIYADSHAREDDTLDLGASELDEILGIPGFCSLMPKDWLVEVNESTVELPGFQQHNGVEAKKRALTQKRVERHREKKKLDSVAPCNAPALPDQDQTKTRPDQDSVACVPSGNVTPAGEMAIALRDLGVSVRSTDPVLHGWLNDGFSVQQATDAVGIARIRKPHPEAIPANYLDKILRARPPPAPRKQQTAWDRVMEANGD